MGSTPFRVLAWPAPSDADLNPYLSQIYSASDQIGAEIVPLQMRHPSQDRSHVFHIHWPEGIFWGAGGKLLPVAAAKAMALLRAASATRRAGGLVVLTVHNLQPHEALSAAQRRLHRWFYRQILNRCDLLVAMTDASLRELQARYPATRDLDHVLVPHPHYRDVYGAPPSRRDADETLGLQPKHRRLGVIGRVRASKNVPEIARAFSDASCADELLIAGECADDIAAEIREIAACDSRIIFKPGEIPSALLPTYFAAIDAIVINQSTTLNSASVLLALSMNTPVVALGMGSITELAAKLGPDWIATFRPGLTGGVLDDAVERLFRHQRRSAVAPLDDVAPTQVSARMLSTFKSLQARRVSEADGR